jgi:hypothetical protein
MFTLEKLNRRKLLPLVDGFGCRNEFDYSSPSAPEILLAPDFPTC